MTDRSREAEDKRADDEKTTRPRQAASLHTSGGEGDETPQDETHDTRWDTEEHSDAPGPTGTG
jgi:hypothetical protein